MKSLPQSHLGLREQIESAYQQRGGVIVTGPPHDGTRRPSHLAARFIYQGCISPFSARTDRFHLGCFPVGLHASLVFPVEAAVMRECCKNVIFLQKKWPSDEIRNGLDSLKRTKMTRAAIRELIVPNLFMPHHRAVVGDLRGNLFDVVDALTALGRAEPESYLSLGLLAGLIMGAAKSAAFLQSLGSYKSASNNATRASQTCSSFLSSGAGTRNHGYSQIFL